MKKLLLPLLGLVSAVPTVWAQADITILGSSRAALVESSCNLVTSRWQSRRQERMDFTSALRWVVSRDSSTTQARAHAQISANSYISRDPIMRTCSFWAEGSVGGFVTPSDAAFVMLHNEYFSVWVSFKANTNKTVHLVNSYTETNGDPHTTQFPDAYIEWQAGRQPLRRFEGDRINETLRLEAGEIYRIKLNVLAANTWTPVEPMRTFSNLAAGRMHLLMQDVTVDYDPGFGRQLDIEMIMGPPRLYIGETGPVRIDRP